MQVKPTSVIVKDAAGESDTIENPVVLMGDYGIWVKNDEKDTLTLYTWERVIQVNFDDAAAVKKVWEEAVLTVFEDLLDDLDDLDDEEPEEPAETPTPETTSEAKADDPTVNPYK